MTTDPPLVSVIIPCFNAGAMLGPALKSVLGQTWPNLEIIFVDNNSTDGSLATARDVLEGQGRPFQVLTCAEQGVNHARNLGFSLAGGDFIQWFDADDELAPTKIALQAAAMQADPAIDIAYGDWVEARMAPGQPPRLLPHRLRQDDDQLARTLAGAWYPPHLYLIRRAAAERLQAAQAWFPGRPVATDVEYSAIAALMGMAFRHVPEAIVRYNLWSGSQIGSTIGYSRRVAVLEAIFTRLKGWSGQVALSERHRVLLNQNWKVWRMAPDAVTLAKLPGRRFRLTRKADGRSRDLRPREAEVARMLLAAARPLTTCHYALMLAETVAALGGDHALAVQAMERLQAEGFMQEVDPSRL
ncbi:MAG: glycosyltransferase [Phenylobacterium sp.]|uniref:glycosyltransferase family 2 protein n=1 Tax=Phenylobacterium sp. TaxID=1871053 RepID=UPI0025F0F4A6|nr:glycosyltransferase family 2 protein [Phenylobacterium sp.]MBI1199452.1 glycosyltransferase [Phenylobacterium sp.]